MMQTKQLTVNSSRFTERSGFSTLLIIIAVAIVGLIAVVGFGILDTANLKNKLPSGQTREISDLQLDNLNKQSSSDEVVDIEKDITGTDLEDLDKEIVDVDRDLGQL